MVEPTFTTTVDIFVCATMEEAMAGVPSVIVVVSTGVVGAVVFIL